MNRPFELTVTHAKRFERFFGWPVLIIFLISFIVMLRTQATWVIPVMLVVSMGLAYKGYMEYRVIRHFAEHQAVACYDIDSLTVGLVPFLCLCCSSRCT